MKSFKSSLLILGMASALTACSYNDVFYDDEFEFEFLNMAHDDLAQKRLGKDNEFIKTLDWANASAIKLTVRQDEFSPMIVRMKKDVPYVMTIENRDLNNISFKADEFFQNTAVAKLGIAVGENQTFEAKDNPELISFVVPAMSQRTIQLMPVMEGRYDFEDASPAITHIPRWHIPFFSRASTNGSAGVIIVD